MSDKIKGLVVVFSESLSIQDAEKLKKAIEMFSGVSSVELSIDNIDDKINRIRVQGDIYARLLNVVWENE